MGWRKMNIFDRIRLQSLKAQSAHYQVVFAVPCQLDLPLCPWLDLGWQHDQPVRLEAEFCDLWVHGF